MKKLLVLRHAKSTWKYKGVRDLDRPLNERGVFDAELVAEEYSEMGYVVEKIYTSPASRTVNTALIFARKLNVSFRNIEIRSELYEAFFSDLIEFIKGLDDKYDTVLLVIHNPLITTLAHRIASIHTDNVPTSGLLDINLNIESWKEFGEDVVSETENYLTPKKLHKQNQ